MKPLAEQQKDAQEAEVNLRAMIVAAGILTEAEAAMYISVEVGDPSIAPAAHEANCSCGHDMGDATLLQVGISQKIGKARFQQIITLVNSGGGSN